MICIGGVCVPYSAVVPLILYGIKWVMAKLYVYGLLPNFVAEMMNLKHLQQHKKSCSAGCNLEDKTSGPSNAEKTTIAESSVVVKKIDSEEEFDELLKRNEKVVVKFTAVWCKPCKNVHPFYEEKCEENPQYDFVTVDVDDFDSIAWKYNVAMMPTFIIVQGDSLLGTYRGSSQPELDTFLKEHL
jgi:thioredoxin 1